MFGVTPSTIRLSLGIEDVEDLKAALEVLLRLLSKTNNLVNSSKSNIETCRVSV